MPVILPPLAGYVALAQKRQRSRGCKKREGASSNLESWRELDAKPEATAKAENIFWITAIVLWWGFAGWAGWVAVVEPARERACARNDGAQKVLESLHSDAIRSANTANFSDYMVVIPQSMLERDSARYAREIQRIIRNSGYDYLYWNDGFHFDVYVCKEDLRRQQIAYDYKQAVKKLALQRRILKQK